MSDTPVSEEHLELLPPAEPVLPAPVPPRPLRNIFLNAEGRLRSGWGIPIWVALVVIFVAGEFAVLKLLHHTGGRPGSHDPWTMALGTGALALALFLATAVMTRIDGGTLAEYGLARRDAGQRWAAGAIVGVVSLTAVLAVETVVGGIHSRVALTGAAAASAAVAWFFAFVGVGFEEELMSRGYLLAALTRGAGFWFAAIVTSGLFMAGHIRNPGETAVGLAAVFFFGIFISLLRRVSGSLWLPIGFHTFWDWGETYFYGVPDSGIVMPRHLLETTVGGPAWLTGGSAGPEGSVVTVALLVFASVVLTWMGGRRRAGGS